MTRYPTLELMKKAGAPLTRDEYLRWAFVGNPPAELDGEEEAALPPEFQKDNVNCITVKPVGCCTIFVRSGRLVKVAEGVSPEWVKEWLKRNPELDRVWVVDDHRAKTR